MADPLTTAATLASIGSFACDSSRSSKTFSARFTRRGVIKGTAKNVDIIVKLLETIKDSVETDSEKQQYRALAKRSDGYAEKIHKYTKELEADRFNPAAFVKFWIKVRGLQQQVENDKNLTMSTSRKIRIDRLKHISKAMQGSLQSLDVTPSVPFDPYAALGTPSDSSNPFADDRRIALMTESVLASLNNVAPIPESEEEAEASIQLTAMDMEVELLELESLDITDRSEAGPSST